MTRLIKWIFILFFLIGMLLGMLVANSVEQTALVGQPEQLTPEEIKRVQLFIRSNNPLNVKSGQIIDNQVSQQDLTALVNYITLKTTSRISRQLYIKISLEEQLANVQLSIRLPETPLGEYLNLTAELIDENSQLKLKSLKLGENNVPGFMMAGASMFTNKMIQNILPEYTLIRESLKSISFAKDQLKVSYVWSEQAERALKTQIGIRMLSDDLKQALIAHANYLANRSYQLPKKTTLNYMMNTMFTYARQRSDKENGAINPVTENKAAFIALGAYILKRNVPEMLGEKIYKSAKYKRVYLRGRHDLSKHFILSAAIASLADSEVAESIGVVKEVRDAKYGSGFSFTDLAADHAGIKLVREAVRSEEQARKFQVLLAEVKTESDYMLDVKNLPESIEHSQFEKNYEDTESEAYLKVQETIKKNIDELPIYKSLIEITPVSESY